jgi:hypothetical protein
MFNSTLTQAIDTFTHLALRLSDADLERPWAWGDYSGEGARFAFFRVYEELRTLAARGHALTNAQRILAQYHAAYRDLQAALLGVDDALASTPPAEGEWPAKKALAHIIDADLGFLCGILYALQQHRAGNWQPSKIPDAFWEAQLGMPFAEFEAMLDGPLARATAYHQQLHDRILREFASITDDELEKPAMYWESEPLAIRFRLHRFDSHMRQHTVQIDKTLAALGHGPTEVRRLTRHIYAAWAEAEGANLGTSESELSQQTAETIAILTASIAQALGGTP